MKTQTIAQQPTWKLENGSMPNAGVIHISDINSTLQMLETYLKIDLINNTIGSVGKRIYSGDIDIALENTDHNFIDDMIAKLKTIPEVINIKKTSVIMTTIKIPNWNSKKYIGVNGTGFVQVDFMFGHDVDLLKLFYHSPLESESKYKGVYRNILLGAIAHFYNRKFSEELIIKDIPKYEERYFWSAQLGLYRGRSYAILSSDKNNVLKKKINSSMQNYPDCGNTAIKVAKELKLSSPDSLYSFETLYNDINTRYNSELLFLIYDEFINNRYVKEMGIPVELQDFIRTKHHGFVIR